LPSKWRTDVITGIPYDYIVPRSAVKSDPSFGGVMPRPGMRLPDRESHTICTARNQNSKRISVLEVLAKCLDEYFACKSIKIASM
jgi:hypothetical protein